MLAGSGASPSRLSAPSAGSIAKLTTAIGSLRRAAYRKRRQGLTASGITVPPTSAVPSGARVPSAAIDSSERSPLSALET